MQPFCVIRFPNLGESLSADGANHDISLQKVKALTPLFQVCEIGINPDILEFGELPESEISEVNLLNNCPIIRYIPMFIRF